ncbi:hypothetical protein IEQ34_010321 [Dendrobium chrysotoxum]|uniref:Mce/MlaD domain-containing protein n=1 Tax=Dendrobium chrysotoxum TaxID=161865 RepID=A0AAV7H156_DENCH|nr:hypothetical protein IEQ34_010321 [Dendrobium chrysotoxum]
MAANPWVHFCPCKSFLSSPFPTRAKFQSSATCPPRKPRVNASSTNISQDPSSSPKRKNPLALVLEVPRTIWRQTLQSMRDFGLGWRSIWEGGVGLFIVSGAVLFALTLVWLRGYRLRTRFKKYQAVFEFSQACGICVGTPIRIRGVTVGNVVHVNSSSKCIDVIAEVDDDKIIIPRNSLVEVNQSGLLMETLIDISPQDPLPEPSKGPLDPECVKEGLIVCHREKIKGQQGVSLDALIGILTRVGQEVEEIGVSKSYLLAEKVASVMQEAQPLVAKIEAIAEDIQPLLVEVRSSTLLKDFEVLTKSLAEATRELRKVQDSVTNLENSELMRSAIFSLIFTLKNIESITSDISAFTVDEAMRRNLKLLIKSLSRLL